MAVQTGPGPQAASGNGVRALQHGAPITRRRPARRLWSKRLVWAAALAAAAAGAYRLIGSGGSGAQTVYVVATVGTGSVEKSVTASGTIKPWSVVDIKSKAGGRVDSLTVEVGDRVRQGQVIARIDPSDTLLTVRTAEADLASARAKQDQSALQYGLQVRQTRVSVNDARAQVDGARASKAAAAARLASAQRQASAQTGITSSNIAAADANYQNALKAREQLDATQPDDRASAQAAYDQAAATERNAQRTLERQQKLLAKGYVARQVADQAEADQTVAAAQASAARARLNALAREQQVAREAADTRTAQAKAQLDNARAQSADIETRRIAVTEAAATARQAAMQVRQAEASLARAAANRAGDEISRQDIAAARASVARSEATLTNAGKTLAETTVRCPINGVVLEKYVEQGTIITSGQSFNSSGTSIVQIGDTSRMYVSVSVDETDIADIAEGQAVSFTVDAYKGASFGGKVARVSPQAQVENNVTTYAVRVEIDNSNPMFGRLRPGMNATCRFIEGARGNVVVIPAAALHSDERSTYVDIAQGGTPAAGPGPSQTAAPGAAAPPDGALPADGAPAGPPPATMLANVHTQRRDVQAGLTGSDTVEIVSGLRPGETVVVQTIEPAKAASATSAGGGSPFVGGGPPPGGPPPPPPGGAAGGKG